MSTNYAFVRLFALGSLLKVLTIRWMQTALFPYTLYISLYHIL